jgi:hypothetical protein
MAVAVVLDVERENIGIDAVQAPKNMPEIKEAFSFVSHDTGALHVEKVPDYYRVVDIEDGTISRARSLMESHQMRHCFNEESIVKALQASAQDFNIAKIQILPEEYLAQAPHPERSAFYLMVPKV